jgi:glucokinase
VAKATSGELLAQLEAAVRALEGGAACRAVGIGLPGIVETASGRVGISANLPVLNGCQVGAELARRTGRPAFAENDANAAALAESWIGAGRGSSHVLLVTLGTGIGGGLTFAGRAWNGKSGFAGEIGHMQVDPTGVACGCGSWGCVETIAGIPGWERRARAALAEGRASSLRGAARLDPEAIVAAARQGDALAIELVDEAARALGVGIASVLALLNLDCIVVGGGVAAAGELLLDRIVEHVRRRTFPRVFADTRLCLATLGGDAGVVGAARAAMLAIAG